MEKKLVKLTSYSNRIEGELVSKFLEGCGIYVELRSDDAGGVYNSMSSSNGVFIWVIEEQLAEAKLLLAAEPIFEDEPKS
ncbi:MAG: hypothetical protein EOP07_24680 [Proteobacteria bacterium]|nr:MAG: hypothetical protein EOP07_24680 [Pseudomonadota bacterium]